MERIQTVHKGMTPPPHSICAMLVFGEGKICWFSLSFLNFLFKSRSCTYPKVCTVSGLQIMYRAGQLVVGILFQYSASRLTHSRKPACLRFVSCYIFIVTTNIDLYHQKQVFFSAMPFMIPEEMNRSIKTHMYQM